MIDIRKSEVTTYDLNNLTYQWEYANQQPGVDLTTTTVDVQRSETPDFSEFETIAAGLNANNTVTYTDTLLSGVITRRYNNIFYRARFVQSDGHETITEPRFLTRQLNKGARKILFKENRILRLRGIPCYIFKRKSYGQPCTECFDDTLGVQLESNCSTCYNTRIVGGYYPAIQQNAFLTEAPDRNTINRFGEFNPGQLMFSITSYPDLAPKDLVVDHLNRRWWIRNVRNTSLYGFVVNQDAALDLVDHNDVVYDLPVT